MAQHVSVELELPKDSRQYDFRRLSMIGVQELLDRQDR